MASTRSCRSRTVLALVGVVAVGMSTSCSGDDAGPTGAGPTGGVTTDADSTSTQVQMTTTTSTSESTVSTSSTVPPGAGPTTTTLPPTTPVPPPTGAPGVASSDAFCRDYARVLATANLLGVATAFVAHPPEELVRLEVIASPAQLAAASVIAGEVPVDAASESGTLTNDVVGPLVERAAEIDEALVAAGLDDAGRDALVAVWDDVLATDDPGDPAIAVDELPADLAEVVAAAATALTLPGYLEDPRTIVDVSPVPAVQQYVATNCPEILGLLGDAD